MALLLVAPVVLLCGTLVSVSPSVGQAAGLTGGAYGRYTTVGLFGGPPSPNGPVPQVALPPAGADPAVTATEPSATVAYGPARIFGGRWPPNVAVAPPSGPITVSTRGKPGPGGFVTSTADIVQFSTPRRVQCEGDPSGSTNCTAPGGFGPSPPTEGEELHSTCTADAKGATGSATFVKAVLAKATDAEGNPTDEEPVPDSPPANYTREGQLTNVGDSYRIVYNEQIKDPNGSITVNAVHLFLLGPVAVGEQILGQVRCGTGGAVSDGPTSSSPTSSPSAAPPIVPGDGGSGGAGVPLALGGGGALLVGVASLVIWTRSRRRSG